jgi:protein-S-isoprenylcysteine O-methyltransferase Ste14
MMLVPEFSLSPLHGLVLIGPLLLARIGILLLLNPSAVRRVRVNPPLAAHARWAMPVYLFSEAALLIYPFFLTIKSDTVWMFVGLPLMTAGLVLVGLSALAFARIEGRLHSGIYRFSRNPMYVGFFLYFTGVGLVTVAWVYVLLAVVEQIALYWFIRAEERWCLDEYGKSYQRYMQEVRRYVGRRSD